MSCQTVGANQKNSEVVPETMNAGMVRGGVGHQWWRAAQSSWVAKLPQYTMHKMEKKADFVVPSVIIAEGDEKS